MSSFLILLSNNKVIRVQAPNIEIALSSINATIKGATREVSPYRSI